MHISGSFKARRLASAFLAFFVFVVAGANGQTPTPAPDKNEVISINTDLIQTSVTVFDKNNRFVEGLKPEQFQLTVDGKPAKIEFFEAVAPVKTIERTENKSTGTTAPASTNLSLRGRKIVFFVDDLHLSLDSLGRTRSTISHFIENDMLPTDSVAIISSSGQIGFLQQFTDNKAVLRAALARLKVITDTFKDTDSPPMPPYTAVRIVNGDRSAAEIYIVKILEGMKTSTGGGNSTSVNRNAVYETVKQRAANITRAMNAVSESAIGSLENLLLTLNQTPGRKIIYYLSDGFYLQAEGGNFIANNRLQRAVNLATRSGSVIYTIDARGLFSMSPDATGERPIDTSGASKSGLAESTAAQEGLFVLANQTGGRFLKNQNYFEKWVDRMLEENASYYVLAWSPESGGEDRTNNKFKRIEVSVAGRPDLTVRLQRGYLTNWEKTNEKIAENNNNNNSSSKNAAKNTTENAAFNLSDDSAPKKFLPTGLSLNYLDVPNVGGVLTSSVQIGTDSLSYGEGGKQAAAVDVVGLIYNEQGKQVADFKTGLNITPQAVSAGANGQSVIYNHRTPLAAGIYLVKVAAREAKTGQVGIATRWIEIPDLSKRQLTLGSILLGAKTVKGSGSGGDAAQQQVQFSVDHRFARPFNLNFMSFIYNAARGATGSETNLTTQIEVFDADGRAVISTPARPLVLKTVDDLARIPLTGAIRQDLMSPGTYLLRITVNDLTAKTKAVQQTVFTIE
ncbi:MAG: VWA domain-containing protein [Acidobacteriota bacterium]|nr:VWA domain-containing protein [Acidobacteriota bacterium]